MHSSDSQSYADDVRLGHVVADAADAASMARFEQRRRSNHTAVPPPVEADQPSAIESIEAAIRQTLRRARPRDSVLSDLIADETSEGTANPASTGLPGAPGSRCWVIQPVNGAANFARNIPAWTTTLTLLDGPEVVAAVVSAPALHRRWWAAKGSGTWTGRSLSSATACQVSRVKTLTEAYLSYASLTDWVRADRYAQFVALANACRYSRGFGDVWSYMLLAEGGLDVVVQPAATLHELAAASLIVTEAGGKFTDLSGNPGPAGGSAVATTPGLHHLVLTQLSE